MYSFYDKRWDWPISVTYLESWMNLIFIFKAASSSFLSCRPDQVSLKLEMWVRRLDQEYWFLWESEWIWNNTDTTWCHKYLHKFRFTTVAWYCFWDTFSVWGDTKSCYFNNKFSIDHLVTILLGRWGTNIFLPLKWGATKEVWEPRV